ncbi:GatB/YqeY domain-containing protein [Shimazuella kribbensis]|uniref:GatB/YqeY domain-containing protein n=1 Tax=Shimazuella kribbensis TaxID=139808 RepID=UPI0004143338|nr:GatB/YqeY domain-containing protein [Shimazuella kribbensis]
MSLTQQLDQDMKAAMKQKDKETLSTIRMVRASIKKVEIDNRGELNEDQALEVLIREIKQRKDSLNEYEKAGREDLAEKERREIAILSAYLPKQLTEEELREVVVKAIADTGATSKKEMGKVMGAVIPLIKGRADSKQVNQLVQQLLG